MATHSQHTGNTGEKKRLVCMKHQTDLPVSTASCRDPDIYCKFRTACPIWFLDKKGGRDID